MRVLSLTVPSLETLGTILGFPDVWSAFEEATVIGSWRIVPHSSGGLVAFDLPAPDWIRGVRVFATIDELTEHFLARYFDDLTAWEVPVDCDGLTEDQWLAQADIEREAAWDDMWALEERLTGRRHPWADDYSPLTAPGLDEW